MFLIRPSSSTGSSMAAMMMMPPIEGTPIFFTPNGSILASRCTSVICLLFKYFMNFSPNQAEMASERIRASNARNEMSPHVASRNAELV